MISLKHSLKVLPRNINGISSTCDCIAIIKYFRSTGFKSNKKIGNRKCTSDNTIEELSTLEDSPETAKTDKWIASVVNSNTRHVRKQTSKKYWSSDCSNDSKVKSTFKPIKSVLHREHYIQKSMYGNLLETQKERRTAKLSSDDDEKSTPPDNEIDSEFFHMFKSVSVDKQQCMRFRRIKIINKKSVSKRQSNNILQIKTNTARDVPTSAEDTSGIQDSLEPKILGNNNVIKEITLYPITGKLPDSDSLIETEFLKDTLNDPERYPSVTRILNETMTPAAKEVLERWKKNMIKKLGVAGFEQYQAELLEDGRNLHTCVQNTLMHKEVLVEPRIQQAYNSLKHVFEDVHDVVAVEKPVSHPQLKYKGIVDCIASYRGEPYVIDWKKSNKSKYTLTSAYDAPTQLAAYIGAICASDEYRSLRIGKGLIVFAYTDGMCATTLPLTDVSLEKYWKIWLSRLKQYHENPERSYNLAKKDSSADSAEIVS